MQRMALTALRLLPNRWLVKRCYRRIYRYDDMQEGYAYCYWITKASFRGGLFDRSFFDTAVEQDFEDCRLLAPARIQEYLTYRYGDYRKLPPVEEQRAAIHAELADANRDYREYLPAQKCNDRLQVEA